MFLQACVTHSVQRRGGGKVVINTNGQPPPPPLDQVRMSTPSPPGLGQNIYPPPPGLGQDIYPLPLECILVYLLVFLKEYQYHFSYRPRSEGSFHIRLSFCPRGGVIPASTWTGESVYPSMHLDRGVCIPACTWVGGIDRGCWWGCTPFRLRQPLTRSLSIRLEYILVLHAICLSFH